MNTTLKQQPDAQRLSLLLATGWTRQKELTQAADELDRQHAEIARLTAENEALKAAVSDAVAAEREACAELMEQQHTWITNVAASALIRARGTP